MTATLLPPIPRPPHDPTSVLCDARVGWPVQTSDHVALTDAALTLARSPDSLRRFTEPSGSFGGLRTPANVAFCGDAIWLLDTARRVLRRFDPCMCALEDVPCGVASALREPVGLAAFGRYLFVGDAGNKRVAAFAQPTLALAAEWRPDGIADWQPSGVAVDRRGVVYVADPLNGMIHRFSSFGWYLGHWDGFGASTHLAIDRCGTVYAAGVVEAFRVDHSTGQPVPLSGSADDVTADFEPLPFAVDGDGGLRLGALCAPPSDAVFDLHGDAIGGGITPVVDRWMRAGAVVLGPFDSIIDHCTWHRAILRGELPSGCSVAVDTLTSEVELPISELDQLPDFAWETGLVCSAFDREAGARRQWDGLVTSQPGRFLWLRLGLRGNGATTPRLDNVEIEFPRISLRRYLPAVYGAEPRSADFTDRLLALFDRELRDTEHAIDTMAELFDPLSTPFLSWIASWIGMTLDRQLPEARQRALLKHWAEAAALRGTRYGLWRVLVVYFGLDALTTHCQCAATPCSCRPAAPTCPPTPPHRWEWNPPPLILEHYKLRRWLELGAGRLGDQAVLWGKRIVNRSRLDDGAQVGATQLKATQDPLRDPFHVYAHRFTVFLPAAAGATPGRRRAIECLIRNESPAHTESHVEYVEARFRIGFQSMIGLDTVVAELPEGVTLGETPIGPGSVLSGNDDALVAESRVGTTAVLE